MLLPSWTASVGSEPPSRPIIRLTQPRRTLLPGSASSTSSMAEKCDRLGTGRPTACTAASSPESHSHESGDRFGCSPNISSAATRLFFGSARLGRAV